MSCSKKEFLQYLTLALSSIIVLLLATTRHINVYDEGIILSNATRINYGQMIHRDFFANYGPAQFYIVAQLLKLSGGNFGAFKFYSLLVQTAIPLAVFRILIKRCSAFVAFLGTAACLICLATDHGPSGYPGYPALLATLISAAWTIQLILNGNAKNATCAGIWTAIAGLFRYDIGVFLLIANGTSIALCLGREILFGDSFRRKSIQEFSRHLFIYVSCAATPLLVALAWYAKNDAVDDFFQQIFYHALPNYKKDRNLPFPALSDVQRDGIQTLVVYFPLISGFIAARMMLKRTTDSTIFAINAVFSVLMAGFFLKGSVRVSPIHMQMAIVPAIILIAVNYNPDRTPFWKGQVAHALSSAFLLVVVFDSGIARLTSGRNTTVFHDITGFFSALKRQDFIGPPPLPRNNGPNESAAFWIGRGRWESLGILKGCTQDSDYLFSGLRNHDRVFINDNVIYYLAGRRPVTKWSHFDPSLQTQRPIQEEIVRDLELNKPPFLWIDALWQNIGEPNNASISSGVKILDDYISSKYEIFSIRDNVGLLSRVGIKLTENCMRARGSI